MDRLSEQNLAAVLARVEAVALIPPDDLTGDARAMFVAIAEANRSRPWSQAHAFALADYCRVATDWVSELDAARREGFVVAGKVNARMRLVAILSGERGKLAKILGLHVGARDRYLGGSGAKEERARKIGAALADSSADPNGRLLD